MIRLPVFPARLGDQRVQRAAFANEYVVALIVPTQIDVVPDFALQRHIRDQALVRFRIQPRHVAGVRVAIRVAVADVEEIDEVVAVCQGFAHVLSS